MIPRHTKFIISQKYVDLYTTNIFLRVYVISSL